MIKINKILDNNYYVFLIFYITFIEYLKNSYIYFNYQEILLFLLFLTFFSFISYYLIKKFVKNKIKSGLIFLVIFIPFLNFSFIKDLIFKNSELTNIIFKPNLFLLLFLTLLSIFLIFFVYKSKRTFNKINNFLNIFYIIHFIISIFTFCTSYANYSENLFLTNKNELSISKKSYNVSEGKDIYFIVFDSYTSNNSLKQYWEYDNQQIINYLLKNHFIVNDSARSNYDFTLFSIGSILNFSYYNDTILNKNIDKIVPYTFISIKNSSLMNILNKFGYNFYNLSPFDFGELKKFYDPNFFPNEPDKIYNYFFNLSALGVLINRIKLETPDKSNSRILDTLKKIIREPSKNPKFVYAHFILPHDPFYFNSKGEKIPEKERRGVIAKKNKRNYLEQVIFTNSIIEDIVQSILNNSKTEPIIVIQGDHGYRYLDKNIFGTEENHSIFFATYLPDIKIDKQIDNITGVNLFRFILNKYFDYDVPFLEHKEIFIPLVEN